MDSMANPFLNCSPLRHNYLFNHILSIPGIENNVSKDSYLDQITFGEM